MKEDRDVSELMKMAKESLGAAGVLFEGSFFGFSASRSYYAMFYATEAILLTKNLSFSKHSSVIGAFGKEFVKTKIFPQEFQEYIFSAFEVRHIGDYGDPGQVSREKASEILKQAKDFIEAIEKYLIKEGYGL